MNSYSYSDSQLVIVTIKLTFAKYVLIWLYVGSWTELISNNARNYLNVSLTT